MTCQDQSSNAPLQGIIFDVDGTLTDTMPVCVGAFQHAILAHTGKAWTLEELRPYFGPSEDGILKRIVGERWEAAMPTFLKEYKRLYEKLLPAFDGISALVEHITDQGLRAAIVTGKGLASGRLTMERMGMEGRFDPVFYGSPAADIKALNIARVLKAWNMAPADVAYVGDTATDMSTARSLGLMALAAAWADDADRKALEKEKPDGFFTSPAEMKEWLDGRMADSACVMG